MALFFGFFLLCVSLCGYSFAPLAYRAFFLGCCLFVVCVQAMLLSEPWEDGVVGCVLLLGAHAAASTHTFFGVRAL